MKSRVSIPLAPQAKICTVEIGFNTRFTVGKFASRFLSKSTRKVSVVSNSKVFRLYGKEVVASLRAAGFEVSVALIGEGEGEKSFERLEHLCNEFSKASLRRTDACVALGGGVVGDVAGLAASVYLRGISLIHIPTSLVAQIDSSIGGKTAINSSSGKNQIGTFHPAAGILTDISVLQTLPIRDVRSGFYEMIKHGAVGDRKLFLRLKKFLEEFPLKNFRGHFASRKFRSGLENLVCSNVLFKASIIAADPKEDFSRTDNRSRKILNFGHTVGHALEKATCYQHFRHGEAVGLGMLVAGEISKNVAHFSEKELKLLNVVVDAVGSLPSTDRIESGKILAAINSDKKILRNSLHWILLEAIGSSKIVSGEKIPLDLLRTAISKFISK